MSLHLCTSGHVKFGQTNRNYQPESGRSQFPSNFLHLYLLSIPSIDSIDSIEFIDTYPTLLVEHIVNSSFVYRVYTPLYWSIVCIFGQFTLLVYWVSTGSIHSIDTQIDCCVYFIYSLPILMRSIYRINRVYLSTECLFGQ